jgi:hypothetical protein
MELLRNTTPWFILKALLAETMLLSMAGSVLGIGMTYTPRLPIKALVPMPALRLQCCKRK